MLGQEPTHGITFSSCVLQPKSRGSVRLRSADPNELPLVDPNYLDHGNDMQVQLAGLRYAREVMTVRPVADTIKKELMPGGEVTDEEALKDHCRATVKTNWHPCGTARIGRADDPEAVLTPDAKVKGVDGLRAFDASLMPTVPHGNTIAPTMAVADRAVDLILF